MLLPPDHARTIRVRCAPKTAPCPHCGKRGRRKRILHRKVRSLAYREVVWLHLTYAEYRARCSCCKYFRTSPLNVLPKADYDNAVRDAVLDRILEDGLNVERTRAAMKRDFLLELSTGFIYDCLRWKVAQLDLGEHRLKVIERFSGTLCIDELHLGKHTLLLATDPIADMPVGFALVGRNDKDHMRHFLSHLKSWGLLPRVVVTDGSNLYPAVLAELWPWARHQLCVFHFLKDVNDLLLACVRRLGRELARQGKAGRKRQPGRPRKARQAARRQRGPTLKEKAGFVLKHRFLIVKRMEDIDAGLWDKLSQMFEYVPALRTVWDFARNVRACFGREISTQTAWRRRAALLRREDYAAVPELAEVMGMLSKERFAKLVAFVYSPLGERERTNNHVERMNRKLRHAEKVRYKWRKRRWIVRYVVLALDRCWRDGAEAPAQPDAGRAREARGGAKKARSASP